MLRYQRDRIPTYESTEDENPSEPEADHINYDPRKPVEIQKFLDSLREFEPQTDLDRRLLQGVLEREKTPKIRKQLSKTSLLSQVSISPDKKKLALR